MDLKEKTERSLLYEAKRRARNHSLAFNLDIEDVRIPEFCPVFKTRFILGKGHTCPQSPTVDKIIPELGYTKGNIIVISWRANYLKRNASLKELRILVDFYEALMEPS